MVHKQKSKCQLRLEARSRACFALASTSSDAHRLAMALQSRIARATEIRAMYTRQLAARARARVLHAQDVARGIRLKRHEETRRFRQSSVSKVNDAARRRHAQLTQLQRQCKQRADWITEKVELVRADQSDRADRARRTLAAQLHGAACRRHDHTLERVRRLHARWQSVESVKARVARVKCIQRWFRRHVAKQATAHAVRQGHAEIARVVSCWQTMHTASFETCMGLVQARVVVEAAERLVAILVAANERERGRQRLRNHAPRASMGMRGRVLLMAGMIACHPQEVVGRDPSSTRLLYAARAMVFHLKGLALLLDASSGSQRTQDLTQRVVGLSARFRVYTEAFTHWKQRDAERLAVDLLTAYRDLRVVEQKYTMQAHAALRGGDGVHELVRQTHGQVVQLQQALKRLLGTEEAQERMKRVEAQVEEGKGAATTSRDSLCNETTVSSSSLPRNAGDQTTKDLCVQGEVLSVNQASGSDMNQTLLADRKLVHELIWNPQLQLSREEELEACAAAIASPHSVAAMAVRVRKAMTTAFWDGVVEANDSETLLACTEELRTRFRGALGGGSRTNLGTALSALANQVDSALDRDELQRLMQNPMENLVPLQMRCKCVVDAIERTEAPARAASTREFRSKWTQSVAAGRKTPVELLVAFLAFGLDKVEDLRIDVLNAHLGLLGAYLQQHGVEYEQQQLQVRLAEADSVDAAFPQTMKWLRVEMEAYCTRSDVEAAERTRLAAYDGEAFKRFLRVSVWALVEKHMDGKCSRVWPETFEHDLERFRSCRDALDRLAVVSSLLAMLQEYAARRHLTLPIGYVSTLGQQLGTLLRSRGVSRAHVAAHAIQSVRQLATFESHETRQELETLETRLLGAFAADNPVFQLLFSRLSRAWECSLHQSTPVEVHPSLAPFAAEMRDVTVVLQRVAQHNESVYVSLYNCIIKRLVPGS
ncbi:hypothetical protein PsorP6_010931 [Peronosclerospora sorghi]|uniref:Uncharacterized protein n=1 Tax=Peronosclerospora sorghi TaxID=230839 RepID=A0ACC0VY55_9STRA|nr:hypothetical protein PsorP6_010931 [Peronosclerospora sorghi]